MKTVEKISVQITPSCITVFSFLVTCALSRFAGNWYITPDLSLINLYFWSLFIPGSLPYWFLFALGIAQDSINGTPLGTSALINMLLVWLITAKLHFAQDMRFSFIWLIFAGVACLASVLQWFIGSLYYMHLMPFNGTMLQWGIICCAYPLLHIVFMIIGQKIMND